MTMPATSRASTAICSPAFAPNCRSAAGSPLYGRIENLFDEKYQNVATYGTEGRTAYGGIRVKLD